MDPLLGSIILFAGNFAPRGWALCQGQLLSIAQNTALFSILGTTYGGNGQTTFALPDLRGRVPMGEGTGPGLNPHTLGEQSGTETVTLISTQMPLHSHGVSIAAGSVATSKNPSGRVSALTAGGSSYADSSAADLQMAAPNVTTAGGSQPHNNLQPYLVLNFIIAMEGIFPSRN